MTNINAMEFLNSWQMYTKTNNGVMVDTHCLLPSGSLVSVLVHQQLDGWVITDNGTAIIEADNSGIDIKIHMQQLSKRLKAHGLILKDGKIHSPRVNLDRVQSAIILVANISKEIAEWLIGTDRRAKGASIENVVFEILATKWATYIPSGGVHLQGASRKQYTFNNALVVNGKKVLFDSVMRNHVSINAKTVANLDIQRREYEDVKQNIIFNDNDNWSSEQLSQLSLVASPIALSEASHIFERLVA